MKRTRSTTSRLGTTIAFAAIRGAATALGSSLIALATWWITHH
ncbi:hypothetical protein [Streptomyces sp. NBC_00996]|nr:hypothetical protein OG390_01135 [Streptomyces sp. NBC_00996]